MNLAFVTDGSTDQLVGITGLLHELRASGRIFKLAIVAPYAKWTLVGDWVRRIAGAEVTHFTDTATLRADDRYSIQMDFADIFMRLAADETILCLDYDHLLLNLDFSSLEINETNVMVSSEVNSDVQQQLIVPTTQPEFHLPATRLNTSLICGRGAVLQKVAAHWVHAYDDLTPFIQPRFRTEIAFTLAAKRMGVSLVAAPLSLQAGVATPDLNCCFFHYGGEYAKALELKAQLKREAEQFGSIVPTSAEVLRIHRNLRANLSHWWNDASGEDSADKTPPRGDPRRRKALG